MGVYEKFNYPEVNKEIAASMGVKEDEYNLAIKVLGRTPNYIELGCISAMYSEHCSYKSSRLHLKKLPTKGSELNGKENCVVFGPGENAGVIRIEDKVCVAFKVESHNHPSYIEPFNGASTGVGGILRDVFTMGARPIAAMNCLRFGKLNEFQNKQILEGVVKGISSYGNAFGVPTLGGDVYFHDCYRKNPLVNAFALGIVNEDAIFTAAAEGEGNPIMYVGAKTGKDGIHGATMSSEEFSEEFDESKRPNVQVGDPFKEKLLLEACLELMKTDAIVGIQDMGAAGLTSSAFEMASRAESGVLMHLDTVPVREEGMTPYELMLSESQERMLVVVKKGREEEVRSIFDKWDLDAECIGEVTTDGLVTLTWDGEVVASVPAAPFSDEAPVYDRPYSKPDYIEEVQRLDVDSISEPTDHNKTLESLLGNINIASKKWIYRQYDQTVGVRTVSKPGSDSGVIRIDGTGKGVALSGDCNSRYCYLDPYTGGQNVIIESAINVACSGARPKAFTNCLNLGSPEKPDNMYQFVKVVEGIAHAASTLDTPAVSGNVSLYNETDGKGILPTPVIVMVGVIDDVNKTLKSHFTSEGNSIYLLGDTKKSIHGSEYLYHIHGKQLGKPNVPSLDDVEKMINFMVEGADKSIIESAHDTSEGGLGVCLAEMSFSSGLTAKSVGAKVSLDYYGRADEMLFGEGCSIVLEIDKDNEEAAEELASKLGVNLTKIGTTNNSGNLQIKKNSKNNEELLINSSIDSLQVVYESSLPDAISAAGR